ncbi:hypothetical protein FHL15_005083 [Xylaria flabelliformis]|uniref:Uncharacterized protein n=1 Tax=Xylaria flabelliformis TaxID=2512241 RepID=A0A553I1C0_9PEZI|nr:hypothetical protein FHL15_005083 [Xylaria flabelliformis]
MRIGLNKTQQIAGDASRHEEDLKVPRRAPAAHLRISGRDIIEAALDLLTAASLVVADEDSRRTHCCLPIPVRILHRGLVRVRLPLGAGLRHLFLTLTVARAVVHVRLSTVTPAHLTSFWETWKSEPSLASPGDNIRSLDEKDGISGPANQADDL